MWVAAPSAPCFDLGNAEVGVVAGDHDVRVADQADPAAEAEPVDRGDHRDAHS